MFYGVLVRVRVREVKNRRSYKPTLMWFNLKMSNYWIIQKFPKLIKFAKSFGQLHINFQNSKKVRLNYYNSRTKISNKHLPSHDKCHIMLPGRLKWQSAVELFFFLISHFRLYLYGKLMLINKLYLFVCPHSLFFGANILPDTPWFLAKKSNAPNRK